MRKQAITLFLGMAMTLGLMAQIPTNDEKNYEYHEDLEVKRASSGELQQRFIHWAKEYYAGQQYTMDIDKEEERFVTIQATAKMPESHFGVNRTHKDRELSYTLKFDAVKKKYSYWINNIQYKCIEVDRKGEETRISGRFEDFKGPTKASVESEINNLLEGVIESFTKAAEVELPEPEPEAAPAPLPADSTDSTNELEPTPGTTPDATPGEEDIPEQD